MEDEGPAEALKCIWCGAKGTWRNQLHVFATAIGNPIAECEWCYSTEWFRRKASNGKQE